MTTKYSSKQKIAESINRANAHTEVLDENGVVGYASMVSKRKWFEDTFGRFEPEVLRTDAWNRDRQSKLMVLHKIARHIVKMPRTTDGPATCAVFAYLVLHEMGKTRFSKLMIQFAKLRVNWRAIKGSDSIEAQIVALRVQGKI